MLYFAYGSNMSHARLCARIQQASSIGVYSLARHQLRFHKAGTDGSAKCDAYFTDSTDHLMEGVLFEIEETAIEILDRVEGLGAGYGRKTVTVFDGRQTLEALTYFATELDPSMRPFTWYKEHVLVGAREAGLSPGSIAGIEAVQAIRDVDRDREHRELAIYG